MLPKYLDMTAADSCLDVGKVEGIPPKTFVPICEQIDDKAAAVKVPGKFQFSFGTFSPKLGSQCISSWKFTADLFESGSMRWDTLSLK